MVVVSVPTAAAEAVMMTMTMMTTRNCEFLGRQRARVAVLTGMAVLKSGMAAVAGGVARLPRLCCCHLWRRSMSPTPPTFFLCGHRPYRWVFDMRLYGHRGMILLSQAWLKRIVREAGPVRHRHNQHHRHHRHQHQPRCCRHHRCHPLRYYRGLAGR